MVGAPADAKNSKLTGVATRFLAAVFRLLLAFLFRLLLPSAPKPAHTPPPSPPAAKRIRGDDLPRLFRTFDRDGDGKITASELRETLADLGIFVSPRDLAAAIAEVDANGDGCVDEEEFVELYRKTVGGKAGDEEEEEMKETFDVFDENGDGFITAEELWKVMGALGLEQGRMMEECRRMIGSVDVDGDGKVDFAEFQVMMRKENQRFGAGELMVSNC